MPLPLYFNEDVVDSLRLSQRTWRLDLAPHKTFELARAVEDPDVGEAAYRALVDEDIQRGSKTLTHAGLWCSVRSRILRVLRFPLTGSTDMTVAVETDINLTKHANRLSVPLSSSENPRSARVA